MKRIFLVTFFLTSSAYAWGPTGHSIVCQIAEENLTKKAKSEVQQILGREALADACNWPDRIRKDKKYEFALTWHYVTIPNGDSYQSSSKEPKGDVIEASERMVNKLSSSRNARERREALSFLGHFIGDLHQPLHVGRENDRGGNFCTLAGGREAGNLHYIWDTKIINAMNIAPYEIARRLSLVSPQQAQSLQRGAIADWASESQKMREEVVYPAGQGSSNEKSPMCAKAGTSSFKLPMSLPNGYLEKNAEGVRERLQAAGIRLAGILNRLFQ
ncbi:MAG: hypothetical protein A4S09_17620 [Proteobacteria bacterium SG_bin7]|nr:MAG: hypothetical protein A4S09_17620 [Proteobacteria bacterium SG_bin7]